MSLKCNPSLMRKQLEEYIPRPQPYFTFTESGWRNVDPGHLQPVSRTDSGPVDSLRLVTWNIDFSPPCPQARMASALTYLQTLIESTPASTAVILCLQEMQQDIESASTSSTKPEEGLNSEDMTTSHIEDAANFEDDVLQVDTSTSFDSDDLGQIAAASWVRDRFHVSDLTTAHWRCPYNSVTLVDRRLAITQVSRLRFVSEFEREALLVDIALAREHQTTGTISSPANVADNDGGGKTSTLRICNVHLDSMSDQSCLRPIQWKACAKYLQAEGVAAGILAGDCNANNPSDAIVPQENGFTDAYLDLGGEEGNAEGTTWGPQSRSRFPDTRMDKVCFCQRATEETAPLRLAKLERIGVGLRVEDEAAASLLRYERRGLDFVTDHYGLMADFEFGKSWKTQADLPAA